MSTWEVFMVMELAAFEWMRRSGDPLKDLPQTLVVARLFWLGKVALISFFKLVLFVPSIGFYCGFSSPPPSGIDTSVRKRLRKLKNYLLVAFYAFIALSVKATFLLGLLFGSTSYVARVVSGIMARFGLNLMELERFFPIFYIRCWESLLTSA